MTVERVGPTGRVGCVVAVETGVFEVLTDEGTVRASLDGEMLCRVARDRDCLPAAGEWVELRPWADGRITLCRSLGRSPHHALADVVWLRPH